MIGIYQVDSVVFISYFPTLYFWASVIRANVHNDYLVAIFDVQANLFVHPFGILSE